MNDPTRSITERRPLAPKQSIGSEPVNTYSERELFFEFRGRYFVIKEKCRPSIGDFVAIEWFGHITIEAYEGQDCLGPVVELRPFRQTCCYSMMS